MRDETAGKETTVTLVGLEDAENTARSIPVFIPIGAALISVAGRRSIDEMSSWGDITRLTVMTVSDPLDARAPN